MPMLSSSSSAAEARRARAEAEAEGVVARLSADDAEARLSAARHVKNEIIGNRTKKMCYIGAGAVPLLVQALASRESPTALLVQSAAALGSFACGIDHGVRAVLDSGALPHLLRMLHNDNLQVVEASARSLKMIFQSALAPKNDMLEGQRIELLIGLLKNTNENVAEVAASVIARCCETSTQQQALLNAGALDILIDKLGCSLKLREASLDALGALVNNNPQTSLKLVGAKQGTALSMIIKLLKDKSPRTRLFSCICLVNISHSIPSCYRQEDELRTSVVSVLVKLLEEPGQVGEESPIVLAHLVANSEDLQKLAVDLHAVETLCNFLQNDFLEAKHLEGVLVALSKLCSQLKESRRKVLSLGIEGKLAAALEHECVNVRLAACSCIKSIARSVKILRTSLTERVIINPLFNLLSDDCLPVQVAALTAISNIVLDFTPHKTVFFNCGGVTLLIKMAKSMDPALRLNAVWALRNLVYFADTSVKERVMEELTFPMLSSLIHDPEEEVQEQALGFLRNIIHGTADSVQSVFAEAGTLFKSIVQQLQISTSPAVCTQGLYVLSNIAAGGEIHKERVLNCLVSSLPEDNIPLLRFLQDTSNSQLRVAGVWCVINVCYPGSHVADQRLRKFKDAGILQQLQKMRNDPCVDVRDRVKTALHEFTTTGFSL